MCTIHPCTWLWTTTRDPVRLSAPWIGYTAQLAQGSPSLGKKKKHHNAAKLSYGVTDDLLGRKSEPELPSNISAADILNYFASFMHKQNC